MPSAASTMRADPPQKSPPLAARMTGRMRPSSVTTSYRLMLYEKKSGFRACTITCARADAMSGAHADEQLSVLGLALQKVPRPQHTCNMINLILLMIDSVSPTACCLAHVALSCKADPSEVCL